MTSRRSLPLAILPITSYLFLAFVWYHSLHECGAMFGPCIEFHIIGAALWTSLAAVLILILIARILQMGRLSRSKIPSDAILYSSVLNLILIMFSLLLLSISFNSYDQGIGAAGLILVLTSVANGLLLFGLTAIKSNDFEGKDIIAAKSLAALNGILTMAMTAWLGILILFPAQGV